MIVTLKKLLEETEGGIASFNSVDLEMARGCLDAAEEEDRSIVLGVATRHWEVLGGKDFIPSLRAFCDNASVPVALHLDHATPVQLSIIERALDAGFSSIMIDGSKLSFSENMEVTKAVVQMARSYGASVEAELGPLPGDEGVADTVDSAKIDKYTNPEEAARFCAETGIDALAVAVGTAHGLYKDAPKIRQDLISEIAQAAGIPLVLHGATGVPDEAIREAVHRGIRKINFFSGLLVAAMSEIRSFGGDDNDYVGFRSRLRSVWKETALEMVRLYRG